MADATVSDLIAGLLVLGGVVLSFSAAVGVVRFGDLYARMHAATKPATLGMILLLVGVGIRLADPGSIAKLALVGLLILLTAPVGAHMIGRAAHATGTQPGPETVLDDLADPPAFVPAGDDPPSFSAVGDDRPELDADGGGGP